MTQKITLDSEDGIIKVKVEGRVDISPEERVRIQQEWEKPENRAKLEELIKIYGEYKKVIDQATETAYKVPTRDIITRGLKQEDLKKYPLWKN